MRLLKAEGSATLIVNYLLILALFVSCTSLQERAEEYLAQGSYSEAISTFEQILGKNQGDRDAQVGLKRARRGWIGKKLIQVRQLRMAGNIEESLDQLLEVYENQNQWQVFPSGNVAFTQEEESAWARKSIEKVVSQSLNDKKPLRAEYYLNRYQKVFQEHKSKKQFLSLKKSVIQLAESDCRQKIRELKSFQYFYGRFLERYCQHWDLPPPELTMMQKIFQKQTYSRIALNIEEAKGFPTTFALDLENKLQGKLQESPWFDSTSPRILDLSFLGQYAYEHTSQPTTLTHTYTVSVPYETTRIEREDNTEVKESEVSTGFKVAALILSAIAGDFGSEKRTSNGDGTVTVHETHYRDELRTTTYSAMAHHETFAADLAVHGRLNQAPIQVVRNEEGYSDSVSHQNNMTSIGLYPKEAHLVGPEDWIQNERQHLSVEFGRNLKDQWRNQYCHIKRFNGSSPEQREQAFRCLEVADSPTPIGFQRWFRNQYGIGINEAIKLLYHDPKLTL